jgi:surface carbohydrate biosynthesis protein
MTESKPTVYIPIEIKFREFHSALFLAAKLSERGYRTFIGTKTNIYAIIDTKKSKAGLFLYKGIKPLKFFADLKKKCEKICILDQELGVAHPAHAPWCKLGLGDFSRTQQSSDFYYENAVRERFPQNAEKLIDLYFLVGPKFKTALVNVIPSLASKTYVTGWPKLDLLRDYSDKIFEPRAVELRKEHGSFLLFCSDFGANTQEKVDGAYLQDQSSGVHYRVTQADLRKKIYERNLTEFRGMVSFLKKADRSKDILPIIVRPHPGEDKIIWEKELQGCRKVKVIYEGSSSPWILAAKGVLHRGCSSASEANLMGVSSAYIILKDFPPRENLSLTCSIQIKSQKDLRVYSHNVARGIWCSKKLRAQLNRISKEEIFQPKTSSADLIADLICSQDVLAEMPWDDNYSVRLKKFLTRLKNYIKRKILFETPVDKVTTYKLAKPSEKIPGGIKTDEVAEFFEKLNFEKVTVSSPSKDVVVIE